MAEERRQHGMCGRCLQTWHQHFKLSKNLLKMKTLLRKLNVLSFWCMIAPTTPWKLIRQGKNCSQKRHGTLTISLQLKLHCYSISGEPYAKEHTFGARHFWSNQFYQVLPNEGGSKMEVPGLHIGRLFLKQRILAMNSFDAGARPLTKDGVSARRIWFV